MATTNIRSNGSKWAGEAPDSVETLLGVLAVETLDPTFEDYGDFFTHEGEGRFNFFGNFQTRSHVFSIDSDDPTVVEPLKAAIIANKATEAYRKARADLRAYRTPEQEAKREAARKRRLSGKCA